MIITEIIILNILLFFILLFIFFIIYYYYYYFPHHSMLSIRRVRTVFCIDANHCLSFVKFLNQKHSETLFYKKKSVSSRDFSKSISQVRYLCLCHYFLTTDLFGVSVKTFRGKVKYIRCFVSVEHTA